MALSHEIQHGLPEELAIRTVDRAIEGYRIFANHEEDVLKVVLTP